VEEVTRWWTRHLLPTASPSLLAFACEGGGWCGGVTRLRRREVGGGWRRWVRTHLRPPRPRCPGPGPRPRPRYPGPGPRPRPRRPGPGSRPRSSSSRSRGPSSSSSSSSPVLVVLIPGPCRRPSVHGWQWAGGGGEEELRRLVRGSNTVT
jgi:hypothetical protein